MHENTERDDTEIRYSSSCIVLYNYANRTLPSVFARDDIPSSIA